MASLVRIGETIPTNRLGSKNRAEVSKIIDGIGLNPLLNNWIATTLSKTSEAREEIAANPNAMATRRSPLTVSTWGAASLPPIQSPADGQHAA